MKLLIVVFIIAILLWIFSSSLFEKIGGYIINKFNKIFGGNVNE